jgi:FdhE protein
MPDPAKRFSATAARLDRLATGHPMEPWLRFVAQLARAQHAAVMKLAITEAAPNPEAVAQAVEARMPPLAADGHARNPVWREALHHILDHLKPITPTPVPAPDRDPVGADSSAISSPEGTLPPATLTAIESLRHTDPATLETQATNFLRHHIPTPDLAAAVFIAAALQVYFTVTAARLNASDLRLLEQRSLCPCCGSPSVSGLITATGVIPGTRYLYCSLCSTAWNHTRTVCITCGGTRKLTLQAIEGDPGLVKVETCAECHTYSKLLYQVRDTQVDPYADDLASLGLEFMISDEGFARHAPNPLLLTGDSEGDVG